RIWNCKWSGKYVLHKTAPPEKQRNKGSKRIGCPFLLIPKNASFATSYQKLITDMKELIESYTICDINVLSQVRLLCELFSNATIVNYDVKNYVYKKYWKQLIIDFPESTEYLLRQLDPRKTTWAKAFTGQIFTAGITSTQRSESINKKQFAGQFAAWCEKTALYITSSLHTDQMNEAVMYCSKRVSFEDPYNLTLEVVDNRLIEFKYDFYQIQFNELLEGVDYSLVAEVWDVQSIEYNLHVGQNSFVRNKLLEKNSSTLSLPSFSDVADS
ncbi:8694_t:CDS:2, partial [Cetraspora pellucida]